MMTRAYILLVLVVISTSLSQAQEVPLERCDRLHVIPVQVGDRAFRFLVDTGATSMLDLHSFNNGRSQDVEVTSWTGTLATSAREVTLSDVAIGEAHLRELKLPAIDLSAIGNACGKRIDGILGADLLERLGATLDLNREMALCDPPNQLSPHWRCGVVRIRIHHDVRQRVDQRARHGDVPQVRRQVAHGQHAPFRG